MSILNLAIDACNRYSLAFCKFVSANDVGATGAHQYGIYIPKNSCEILFDNPGKKGENKDKLIKIRWQNTFETDSRFIWYGQMTRSEYRITRFGRDFPFLKSDNVGDLFILVKVEEKEYLGFFLSADEDIDHFLANFNMSSVDTNALIKKGLTLDEGYIRELFHEYIQQINVDFPSTRDISSAARRIYSKIFTQYNGLNPDKQLLWWLDIEYSLFKAIENERYREQITKPFRDIEEFITCANTLLNRRKSRAGKSLENHLAEIFRIHDLRFSSQAITESHKRPDFIFPDIEYYHDVKFNFRDLTFLGAKTTCKDRWRQILNEADRIPTKHLFTLQQGISANQLGEMYSNNIVLVVPLQYMMNFPKGYRDKILSLGNFINLVKTKQNSLSLTEA